MRTFEASRLSGSGNAVFPDEIIIDDDTVTYRKRKVIGYTETSIAKDAIASVTVRMNVLFADIAIESKGGQKIVAGGFSRSDAKAISRMVSPR